MGEGWEEGRGDSLHEKEGILVEISEFNRDIKELSI